MENELYVSNFGRYSRLAQVFARGRQPGSCIGKNPPLGETIGTISILPGVTIGTLVTKLKNCLLCFGEASNKAFTRKFIVGDEGANRLLRATPPSPPIAATATRASAAPFPPSSLKAS